jgi:phage protein D
MAFALQLMKKHGKTSVWVAEEFQLAICKQNIKNRTYIIIRIHKHKNKIHNLQNYTEVYKTYNHTHKDRREPKGHEGI